MGESAKPERAAGPSPHLSTSAGGLGARGALWLALAAAAGAYLRLYGLADQVMGGDELHAVRAALHMRGREILVTYQRADHCIPLSFLFRVGMALGLEPTELLLRAPSLLASLGLLAAVPLLLWRRAGPRAAVVLAWLLAISPNLVLYGRLVRSYAILALLAFLAVWAFGRWWSGGRRRWAAAYVLLAGAAMWFHLGAGPFVLAPFGFAAVDALVRGRAARGPDARSLPGRAGAARSLGALALVGLCVLLALAAFLVPARESFLELLEWKRGRGLRTFSAFGAVARMLTGTSATPLVLATWALGLLGLSVLWRRSRALVLYGATPVVGHFAGMYLLAPMGLHVPLVLDRYSIVVQPLVLVPVAVGAAALASAPRLRALARWSPHALVLALFLLGPLADPDFRSRSFQHHKDRLDFRGPWVPRSPTELPRFHRQIAGEPDDDALVEGPWDGFWGNVRAYMVYQSVHGRRVLACAGEPLLEHPDMRWRNLVQPDPEAILAAPARWFVLHLDVGAEEARVVQEWREDAPPRRIADAWRALAERAQALSLACEAAWGPPPYDEGGVRVWDLKALRR